MKLIYFIFLSLIIPLKVFSSESITDGLYYSYWVYAGKDGVKNYPVFANMPKKNKKFQLILKNEHGSPLDNEIYIKVLDGEVSIFYQQGELSDDGYFVTFGWATATQSDKKIMISPVNIKDFSSKNLPSTPDFLVGDKFRGKPLPLVRNEIVPISNVTTNSFDVDCTSYLKENKYVENGIPLYDDGTQSYNATIFSTANGACGLLLDNNVIPEIKHGWILFKKIK